MGNFWYLTGCSVYYLHNVNGCSSETVHFRPNVFKAKMRLRGAKIFQFSKICLHFLAVYLQFFKKICHFSNTVWLYIQT